MKVTKRGNIGEVGFSLVELLLVLGIISIMAAIVINSFSNAAQDSRNVVSRQQQATLQSAVNNWVAGQVGGYERPDPNNPNLVMERTVSYVRNKYNYATNYWTEAPGSPRSSRSLAGVQGRLDLIKNYLDEDTYEHFIRSSYQFAPTKILSGAMRKTDQYLMLSAWEVPGNDNKNTYPKVNLFP
ncbi:MAG TPA: type II secretion system protein [Verrucomicrobia bacterium]|nr:type II secretion system protein [Verrucomicrobiales bacterium]HIL56167.1 type II secretion system protein [Verrucomicrobiota bacterium]